MLVQLSRLVLIGGLNDARGSCLALPYFCCTAASGGLEFFASLRANAAACVAPRSLDLPASVQFPNWNCLGM